MNVNIFGLWSDVFWFVVAFNVSSLCFFLPLLLLLLFFWGKLKFMWIFFPLLLIIINRNDEIIIIINLIIIFYVFQSLYGPLRIFCQNFDCSRKFSLVNKNVVKCYWLAKIFHNLWKRSGNELFDFWLPYFSWWIQIFIGIFRSYKTILNYRKINSFLNNF